MNFSAPCVVLYCGWCFFEYIRCATKFALKIGISEDSDISVSLAEEFLNSVNITDETNSNHEQANTGTISVFLLV